MEEFLGPQAQYNEEEEERKYYRRKRLGVIKNVVASSFGAMIVYSVYMGELLIIYSSIQMTEISGNLSLEAFGILERCVGISTEKRDKNPDK